MKTLLLKVDPENPEPQKIQVAAEIIQKRRVSGVPNGDGLWFRRRRTQPEAVLALFEAKRRPLDNPPIVHVADRRGVYL